MRKIRTIGLIAGLAVAGLATLTSYAGWKQNTKGYYYEDNNGKQRNFFPDYVVKTKNGLWIIETKGGQTKSGQSQDIDPFSAKKFEALKAYIKMQKSDGRNIRGGFVRQNGIYLCICTNIAELNFSVFLVNDE